MDCLRKNEEAMVKTGLVLFSLTLIAYTLYIMMNVVNF